MIVFEVGLYIFIRTYLSIKVAKVRLQFRTFAYFNDAWGRGLNQKPFVFRKSVKGCVCVYFTPIFVIVAGVNHNRAQGILAIDMDVAHPEHKIRCVKTGLLISVRSPAARPENGLQLLEGERVNRRVFPPAK